MSPRPHLKRKLKILSSSKCQTDLSLFENPNLSTPQQKSDTIDLTLHNSQSNIDVRNMKHGVCIDCEQQLSRKCANCTLRKLMRQHVTGKLKIEELKSTLTKICLDSDSDYKRHMIAALENFRGNIRERKRISGNRIENFIDAVTCNKNILLRRDRELCFAETNSVDQLYLKGDAGSCGGASSNKKRKCISVENVAVGPSIKILESVNDEIPTKMNHIDQATEPMFSNNNLELIKKELEEMECLEKLQEISKHVDNLLKTKSDMDVALKLCHSFTEMIEQVKQTEILEPPSGCVEESEEFVEAEECCVVKESKSLTGIRKKLNKTKENSCLIS